MRMQFEDASTFQRYSKYHLMVKPPEWHSPHRFIPNAYADIKRPGNPLFSRDFRGVFVSKSKGS